jgi:hypothetical protein
MSETNSTSAQELTEAQLGAVVGGAAAALPKPGTVVPAPTIAPSTPATPTLAINPILASQSQASTEETLQQAESDPDGVPL